MPVSVRNGRRRVASVHQLNGERERHGPKLQCLHQRERVWCQKMRNYMLNLVGLLDIFDMNLH